MGRHKGDHAELDEQVYAWLAEHPGSSSYRIARALGLWTKAGGRVMVHGRKVDESLRRLEIAGRATWTTGRTDNGQPRKEWTT